MKVAVLTANLGSFDSVVLPVQQDMPVDYHCFTDEDFPPIAGLTPRLQYRIPKMFGWQMKPGYDFYIWLDGSMTLPRSDSVAWLLRELANDDIAFFKHPWRKTVKEEVDHIEERLQRNDPYITPRYKNGLHKESLAECNGIDDLYASPVFIYANSLTVQKALKSWWALQSRYYSCDQITLTTAMKQPGLSLVSLWGDPFNSPYVKRGNKHK